MSLLERVRFVQRWPARDFRPFLVDGRQMGWVTHRLAERLADFTEVFRVRDEAVVLDPRVAGFERRTAVLDQVVRDLVASGHVPRRRGELFPLLRDWQELPLAAIDRGAVPIFGVRSFGVHLNGIVRDGERLSMWIGRRSLTKPTAPGKLDHLVAGGQPFGLTPWENLLKECHEEAGLTPDLVARARPAGLICYRCLFTDGQRDDVLWTYDLELPPDWRPRPLDGEVQDFELMPLDEVVARLRETEDFKFNVALVIIDFLIRHGHVGPDEPGFQEICRTLRSGGA